MTAGFNHRYSASIFPSLAMVALSMQKRKRQITLARPWFLHACLFLFRYSVVGVMEELATSLVVLEARLPDWFQGAAGLRTEHRSDQ